VFISLVINEFGEIETKKKTILLRSFQLGFEMVFWQAFEALVQ